jgi:hypothetical protein
MPGKWKHPESLVQLEEVGEASETQKICCGWYEIEKPRSRHIN